MDGVLASRIAAGILAAGGLALLWLQPAGGVVLLVTALALVLVARPEPTSGTQWFLDDLVRDLGLRGPGHHVPAGQGVRLFIPADARGPYLMPHAAEGAIHRDPPASIGLALDPPGAALIQRWADMDGLPAGQGPEEVLRHLMRALPRLGLASKVDVAAAGDSLRIRMQLMDPAPALAAQDRGWHLQGGCPAQSFACGIAALALDRPVRTASSHTDADGSMTLEVVAGSTA